MIGVKRTVFLFCLALLIGLTLVYLRTQHMQAIYHMTSLAEQESQLRQSLWHQQLRLSGVLESPEQIRERIEKLQLSVKPPGAEDDETAR